MLFWWIGTNNITLFTRDHSYESSHPLSGSCCCLYITTNLVLSETLPISGEFKFVSFFYIMICNIVYCRTIDSNHKDKVIFCIFSLPGWGPAILFLSLSGMFFSIRSIVVITTLTTWPVRSPLLMTVNYPFLDSSFGYLFFFNLSLRHLISRLHFPFIHIIALF